MKVLILIAALLAVNVQGATKATISSWTATATNSLSETGAPILLNAGTFPSDIAVLASGAVYYLHPKFTSVTVNYAVKLNAGSGVTSVGTSFTPRNGSPATSNCQGVSNSDTTGVNAVSGTCTFNLNTLDGVKYAFTLTFSDLTTNTLQITIIRAHITSFSLTNAAGLKAVSIYPTASGWSYTQTVNYGPSDIIYTWSHVFGPSNLNAALAAVSNTYWADSWAQNPRIRYTIDGTANSYVDPGSTQPLSIKSCASSLLVNLYAQYDASLPQFSLDYTVNIYTLIITTFQATSAQTGGAVLYSSANWNGANYWAVTQGQVNSNSGPTSGQQCTISLGANDQFCVQTQTCNSAFDVKDTFTGVALTGAVNANLGNVVCYSPSAGASFTHSIFSTLKVATAPTTGKVDQIEYQCRVTKAADYGLWVRVFGLKAPANLLVTNGVQTLNITNATGTSYQAYSARYITGATADVTFTQPTNPLHVCAFTEVSPSGAATWGINNKEGPNTRASARWTSSDVYLTIVCVPVAISVGDPHVTGFKGQQFDIVGNPGSVYNWYSDVDFQMNVKIDRPDKAPVNTTYATAVGLSFGRFGYVTMQVEPFERTTLHPRRLIRNSDGTEHYVIDGFCGKLMWTKAFGGGDHHDVLHIEWQQYTISIQRRAFWDGPSKKFNYLNIAVQTTPTTAQSHGVLGQTFNLPATATENDLQGKLEDYEVKDGLLGTDYKYRVYRFDAGKFTQAQCKAGENKAAAGSSSKTE